MKISQHHKRALWLLIMLICLDSILIEPCKAQSKYQQAIFEGVISTDELLKNFDSVAVNKNGTIEGYVPPSSVREMEMLVLKLSVVLENDRVVVKGFDDQNVQIQSGLGRPDSTVYEKNKWFTYRNGIATVKPPFQDSVIATNEQREIKGFSCLKYIWISITTKRETELWVSEDLPTFISPFSLSLPVEGGIVQSRQLGSNFTYRLVEIK